MSVENETIADIAAEMRAPHDEICEKCHEEPNESCPYCGDPNGCNSPDYGRWPGVMTELADRIEAAYKREVEKLNSVIQATVSRSDAEIDRLRRKAEELRKKLGNAYSSSEASPRSGCPGNGAKLREALVMVRNLITKEAHEDGIFAVIDRALAEPPRNCDMLCAATVEENIDAALKRAGKDGMIDYDDEPRFARWFVSTPEEVAAFRAEEKRQAQERRRREKEEERERRRRAETVIGPGM